MSDKNNTAKASFKGEDVEELGNILDDLLHYGGNILRDTSLEWVASELLTLFGENTRMRDNFITAPASTSLSRHHCYTGGLMYHSLEVYMIMSKLWWGLDTEEVSAQFSREARAKAWVASLLHDLNKTCDPNGEPVYVENVLSNGKVSDRKPWMINKEAFSPSTKLLQSLPMETGDGRLTAIALELLGDKLINVEGGVMSLLLAGSIAPELRHLPDDVIQAIHYHEGGYGQGRYAMGGKETQLSILIHAADMLSSRQEGLWITNEWFEKRRLDRLEGNTTPSGE